MNAKPTTGRYTLGRDLGDRRHTVCVLDEPGDIVIEEGIANTRECVEAFAQRLPRGDNRDGE